VQRIWLDTAENKDTPKTGFSGEPPEAVSTVRVLLTLSTADMIGRRGMSPEAAVRALRRTEPFQNYPALVAGLPGAGQGRVKGAANDGRRSQDIPEGHQHRPDASRQADKETGPITPALIAEKVEVAAMVVAPGKAPSTRQAAVAELIRRFSHWIGQDSTLSDNEGHKAWLGAARKKDWRYWQRYQTCSNARCRDGRRRARRIHRPHPRAS
jgi:hypothetical protein